ncbi:MAG: phage tail protein, partial [Peptostreptococcaceae bacterium]|nr:phage tail protein [Peptostreptococcaceae bacterium]
MLFILDKSHEVVGSLNSNGDLSKITTYFDDIYLQELSTGAETFTFSTMANTSQAQHLVVGNYIAFKEDGEFKLFNILQIEENHDEVFTKTVYCEMAGIELVNEIIRPMTILNSSIRKFLTTILEGTEWQLGKLDAGFTQVYDFKVTEYKSVYELIQEYAIGVYGAEISYRVVIEHGRIVGKYIDCYKKRGNDNGFRFEYGSNLTSVVRTVDTSNLATALIGVGNSGITFKEVETDDKPLNQDFIANETAYEQWNINGSHIFGVHKADTDSPQELLRLTRNALAERANPNIKYEMKVELLGEDVKIGDTVFVVDHEFNPPLYLSARVNELTKSRTDSSNNGVVLANFKEVRSNITSEMRDLISSVEDYIDNKFPIGSDQIQNGAIGQDHINKEYHNTIIADAVHASYIQTQELIANKANIGELQATNAQIENLKAQNAHIEQLVANKADVNELNAINAQIENLSAEKADIIDLQALNAQISSLKADKADIVDLNAIKGEIDVLESEVAKIESIQSSVANIDHILAGNITSDNIATGTITAGSGIIADGAIGNAQISEVDAGKISAGTIDTSKVTVQGANGNLRLKGNRLQVFQGTGSNAKERVSVGDVDGDGTTYGLRVRGVDGQTVLFDENGVTSEGITDGSITNDKISDNAEIDGAKLNINSVVTKINEDGTEVIKGTKIEVDGTSLTTKLSNMSIKQTEDSERITQAQTQITATENALKLKVDEQTYQSDKADTQTSLEKHTSEINALKGEISLKVDKTDIKQVIDEVSGELIDSKIDTAKSEIKVTTDAISQNVANLSQTVSTKADGSTVTTLSNKVGSLETSINGISGQVVDLENTTTELENQANGMQGEVNNIKNNIASLEVTTSGISQKVNNIESTTADLSSKVDDMEIEYDTTKSQVAELETNLNSITQRVSSTETTTTTLHDKVKDIETSTETLNGKVASIETGLEGINSKVSDVETKTTILDGKVVEHESRISTAEQKITSNAITSVVRDSDFIQDMNGEITSNKNNISKVEQTANSITNTVKDLNGKYTEIKQTIDSIDLTGVVKFNDLSTQGGTVIHGGNIKSDSLSINSLSSNNANPIIKLFPTTASDGTKSYCSIDATKQYEQGVGSAIRLKWDSMNYMLQKRSGVDFYMEPRESGNAFGFKSDYGEHTNNYESRIITKEGTLCFRRTDNNDASTSSLFFYTGSNNHTRKLLTSYDLTSSVTSTSTTMPATAYGVKQAYDKAVSAYNVGDHSHPY